MFRIVAVAVCFLVVACSENPITSSPTEPPQARPAVIQQSPQIALLQLEQGFNDLNRWIVSGKIKNISPTSVSGISIKATLYQYDGSLISILDERPEHGGFGDLPPQGETTFKITFFQYLHLDQKLPDRARTVVDVLVDGYKVSYDNRTSLPPHRLFDFRFSNWGDDEETVASNEPGRFVLTHIDGGKSTKVSIGTTTDELTFPGDVRHTVNIKYQFTGGMLQAGVYSFSQTGPTFDTVQELLNDRYGTGSPLEDYPGVVAWTKNSSTFVYLEPANADRGVEITYLQRGTSYNSDEENDYNRLPLRVIISD